MPVTFTTDLPDVESMVLDASQSEQLTADWDGVLNNGEYRLEFRDDDPDGDHPPYEHETTNSYGTAVHTIADLLGGERYSVRIRTQTDYRTGSWLKAEELTKLIPSDDLTFSNVAKTDLVLSWTIKNDFRGSHRIYRRRVDYDHATDFFDDAELIATVGDETSSMTDDEVGPGRTYEYRVRTQTQWQQADSAIATATTVGLEVGSSPVPPHGWYAEIDHPNGTVLTPQILDDNARLEPRLNALPQTRLPVPRDEKYLNETLEGAEMRVWKDGDRRPVDELEEPTIAPDRDELVGIGGTQLERRVQIDAVDEQVDEFVRQLIENNTDYVANVDEPRGDESEGIVQEASTTTDWEQITEETDLSTIPVGIENGDLYLQVSNLHYGTANEDLAATGGASPNNSTEFADGQAMELDSGSDSYETRSIELEYTIPAEYVRIGARMYGEIDSMELTLELRDAADDSLVASTTLYDGDGFLTDAAQWFFSDGDFGGVSEWAGGDIPPGEYYIRVEAASFGNPISVDIVSIHDSRYAYEFDDSTTIPTDGDPYLDGPEPCPNFHKIRLDTYSAVLSVRGGAADITMDDTSNNQEIAISNDGSNWIREQNSTSAAGEFDQLTGRIMTEITLSRYGDAGEGETPRYGVEGQRVSSYELTATLNEKPVISHRTFDDDLKDILTAIAEDTNSVWEVRQDGDETTVEWSQPGLRPAQSDADVADYKVTKNNRRILKATVIGGRTSVSDEAVTADYSSGIDLAESRLIPGSEDVRDANGDARYRPGIDYDIQPSSGVLEIREGGDITDGQELLVDYDHNANNSYEHDDYDGDARSEITERMPQATTERACGQVAKILVDDLSTPRYEADVTIPAGEEIGGLIETLDLEDVPGDAMAVYDVQETPEGLQLRLGNRDNVDETVRRIQSRLSAATERV